MVSLLRGHARRGAECGHLNAERTKSLHGHVLVGADQVATGPCSRALKIHLMRGEPAHVYIAWFARFGIQKTQGAALFGLTHHDLDFAAAGQACSGHTGLAMQQHQCRALLCGGLDHRQGCQHMRLHTPRVVGTAQAHATGFQQQADGIDRKSVV